MLLNETWRAKERERWKTKNGHMFCGAGGSEGSNGVAILIHKRWTAGFKAFQAINDRLCIVDCKISGYPCRLISVYFPHAGYEDEEVEGLYFDINTAIDAARRQKRTRIVMGDWHAVLGERQEGDEQESVGLYGTGCRNDRGNWLAQWAGGQKMSIANTCFEKTFDEQWTHVNGSLKRQIDFGCICTEKADWLVDAGANECIGVGKDHRTVYMHLALPHSKRSRRAHSARIANLKGWRPIDKNNYKKELDVKLSSMAKINNPMEKYDNVEKILRDVGQTWAAERKEGADKKDQMEKHLRDLISQRKLARQSGNQIDVKRFSKLIQKEIKRVAKGRKT